MENDYNKCRLCNAVNNPFTFGELRQRDTVLFKTNNFVLLPAIGPLTRGHAMIVSRKHYPSLAAMPKEAVQEYEAMIRLFFGLPGIAGNLLEAEHGSTANCNAGACVAHTHIHLLPGFQEHANMLEGQLPCIGSFPNQFSICGRDQPYISFRKNLEELVVFEANSVPTQMIRRVLCARLKQTNWDWRMEPRNGVIDETVTFWNAIVKNVELA